MKIFILLLFLALSYSGFSQLEDTLDARNFWADNINNIVTLNKSAILSQTHFPLKVGDQMLTLRQFELSIDKYFNKELRAELSAKTIGDIDAWKMYEEVQAYMLVCEEGMVDGYDLVVLFFLDCGGKWLLNALDYQKDEENIIIKED